MSVNLNSSLVSLIRDNDYTGVQRLIESGADLDKQINLTRILGGGEIVNCTDYRIYTLLLKNGFMLSCVDPDFIDPRDIDPRDMRTVFLQRLRNAQTLISEERTARDQHIDDSLKTTPAVVTQIISSYDSSSSEEVSAVRSFLIEDSLQMMPAALTSIINDYDEISEDHLSMNDAGFDIASTMLDIDTGIYPFSPYGTDARDWRIDNALQMIIPSALTKIISQYDASSSKEEDDKWGESLPIKVLWPIMEYMRR